MAYREDDRWSEIVASGGARARPPRVGVVYGRRLVQEPSGGTNVETRVSFSGGLRRPSFVPRQRTSWNRSLSIRGRESIFVAPGAYLQQKPCGAPKRPPKPCNRAKKHLGGPPDLSKEKAYFEEVDAFDLMEESPSPKNFASWNKEMKENIIIHDLPAILERWKISSLARRVSYKPLFDIMETPILPSILSNNSTTNRGSGTCTAGRTVCKVVPFDGDLLVNGENQKRSDEILEEVLLSLTLNNLRADQGDDVKTNSCNGFIQTKDFRVCQGPYDPSLIRAWEDYDAERGSENDHPKEFTREQYYIVFVLADGGTDLESFALVDYKEAYSLLVQVTASLAVAETACEFEHRDLHWGNILLAQDETPDTNHTMSFTLQGKRMCARTFGLNVSIIDFTLSRINTGTAVLFLDLSADPALFEGKKGDKQAETYRRMKQITQEHWEGSFPKTNVVWLIYLVDMVLQKLKPLAGGNKIERELRSFKKRMASCESAGDCLGDSFFADVLMIEDDELPSMPPL